MIKQTGLINRQKIKPTKTQVEKTLELYADINGQNLAAFVDRFKCRIFDSEAFEHLETEEIKTIINNQIQKPKTKQMANLPKAKATTKPTTAQKEYDNTNRGALFINSKKASEKHPDFTGKINVLGNDYYLSAWNKTSKDGDEYLSVTIKPIEEQA